MFAQREDIGGEVWIPHARLFVAHRLALSLRPLTPPHGCLDQATQLCLITAWMRSQTLGSKITDIVLSGFDPTASRTYIQAYRNSVRACSPSSSNIYAGLS
jgi:hypothetical protein